MDASQYAECYKEAQADITRKEEELAELRAVARFLGSKAGMLVEDAGGNHKPDAAPRTARVRIATGPYSHMKQIRAAEEVLRAAGEPLRTAAIAERMIEGGFPAKETKKLIGAIFTGMTRRPDTFSKSAPGMWTVHLDLGFGETDKKTKQ